MQQFITGLSQDQRETGKSSESDNHNRKSRGNFSNDDNENTMNPKTTANRRTW